MVEGLINYGTPPKMKQQRLSYESYKLVCGGWQADSTLNPEFCRQVSENSQH